MTESNATGHDLVRLMLQLPSPSSIDDEFLQQASSINLPERGSMRSALLIYDDFRHLRGLLQPRKVDKLNEKQVTYFQEVANLLFGKVSVLNNKLVDQPQQGSDLFSKWWVERVERDPSNDATAFAAVLAIASHYLAHVLRHDDWRRNLAPELLLGVEWATGSEGDREALVKRLGSTEPLGQRSVAKEQQTRENPAGSTGNSGERSSITGAGSANHTQRPDTDESKPHEAAVVDRAAHAGDARPSTPHPEPPPSGAETGPLDPSLTGDTRRESHGHPAATTGQSVEHETVATAGAAYHASSPNASESGREPEPCEPANAQSAAPPPDNAPPLPPRSDPPPARAGNSSLDSSATADTTEPAVETALEPATATTSPSPAGPPPDLWMWKPLPDEPDPREEYIARVEAIPAGGELMGARVRGKQHKHKGTNCDDAFDFATCGDWTIVVVSDGAGGSRLSRIGSQAACEAATSFLKSKLAGIPVPRRSQWAAADFAHDAESGEFRDPGLKEIQGIIEATFAVALEQIDQEIKDRAEDRRYTDLLGRPLEFRDFYCTLLVTVHARDVWSGVDPTTGAPPRSRQDLVFSCAVGDGMIAVIRPIDATLASRAKDQRAPADAPDRPAELALMMTPDSGEFSGETEFLTHKVVESKAFISRIRPYIGPTEAVLSMTDGVADDYFPNDPGMLQLYGDLLLNGIVTRHPSQEALRAAEASLDEASLASLESDDLAACHARKIEPGTSPGSSAGPRAHVTTEPCSPSEAASPLPSTIENQGTDAKPFDLEDVFVRYLREIAPELGRDPQLFHREPDLLEYLSSKGRPLVSNGEGREQRLMKWLDAYRVRGSFDDRTLVILSTGGTRR